MTVGVHGDNSLTADGLATVTGKVLPGSACFKLTAAVFSVRIHPSSPQVNLSLHNS